MKLFVSMLGAALACTMTVSVATAAPVEPETAGTVARNFWNLHRDKEVKPVEADMTPVATDFDGLYVFTADGGQGFVIVPADDRAWPVVAYSFSNFFDAEENENVRYWLGGYQEQMEKLRASDADAADEVKAEWQRLSGVKGTPEPQPLTAVEPLLRTAWDQSPYYNALCPYDSEHNTRTPAGCIVTAMTQVMRYWEHPLHGTGSHSYTHTTFGTLSADFASTTYDWDNMPYSLTGASSTAEKTAVSTLMYHAGVAVEMDYAYDGSGAYMTGGANTPCTKNALINYFDYNPSLYNIYRSNKTEAEWTALVKAELDSAWPVLYSGYGDGGGHAFVCDGYNANGLYHFNWGWGGVSDGYYMLSDLAPSIGGTGTNNSNTFNNSQHILVGVHPTGTTVAPEPDPDPVDENCVILQFPYSQDFDQGGYDCITINDADGDGNRWGLVRGSGVGNSICAYIKYASNHQNNDFINMPKIAERGDYTVTWKARAYSTNYPETYEVWAEDSVIFSETLSSSSFVDRSATFYVGYRDTVRIRFRNISYDQHHFYVDNVVIEQNRNYAGIDEAGQADGTLSLYPNPASESLTIATAPGTKVEIMDMTGRTLLTHTASTGHEVLPVASLAKGIYMVRATADGNARTAKFIKK